MLSITLREYSDFDEFPETEQGSNKTEVSFAVSLVLFLSCVNVIFPVIPSNRTYLMYSRYFKTQIIIPYYLSFSL